jgi:hypothetical protein
MPTERSSAKTLFRRCSAGLCSSAVMGLRTTAFHAAAADQGRWQLCGHHHGPTERSSVDAAVCCVVPRHGMPWRSAASVLQSRSYAAQKTLYPTFNNNYIFFFFLIKPCSSLPRHGMPSLLRRLRTTAWNAVAAPQTSYAAERWTLQSSVGPSCRCSAAEPWTLIDGSGSTVQNYKVLLDSGQCGMWVFRSSAEQNCGIAELTQQRSLFFSRPVGLEPTTSGFGNQRSTD